ncbi:MAG TPA: YtxH domain-containing protein [Blastocatellia bacterium]|nr:YtxH domain-containing protein [Blastocatellia bacterium]
MAQHEDSSASEKLTYLLIGAGLGATIALLFAPKPGRELRTDIVDYTKRGVDAAGEGARALTDRANELYETGRGKVGEYYETGREKVSDVYGTAREKVSQSAGVVSEVAGRQKEQIAAAIEAGKQAYREEKRKAGESGGATLEGDEA